MNNIIEYKDLLAFHPGYYILENIDELGYSQEEFAQRLGVTPKTISVIVNGQNNLTREIAEKLSRMLGTSVELWLNLQKKYEDKKREIEQAKWFDRQSEIVKLIDYSYFIKIANLPAIKGIKEKITNLCKYFHVADLDVFFKKDFLANYRSGLTNIKEKNVINSKIWLQTAINIAKSKIVIKEFNPSILKKYISEIKSLTVTEPDFFLPKLKKIFENCGVNFVFLPYLKNSGINGAVKWIDSKHPILAMNDRRNYSDTFWFSLFHEIKHLLQQKTKIIFFDGSEEELEKIDLDLEKEADEFARDTLIPVNLYRSFIDSGKFRESDIRNFAGNIGLHSAIILGRLQNDGLIPHNRLNSLKTKYNFAFTLKDNL